MLGKPFSIELFPIMIHLYKLQAGRHHHLRLGHCLDLDLGLNPQMMLYGTDVARKDVRSVGEVCGKTKRFTGRIVTDL